MVAIEAVVSEITEEGELFTVEVMDISNDVWYSTPSIYPFQ